MYLSAPSQRRLFAGAQTASDGKTAGKRTTPAATLDPSRCARRERRGTLASISGLAVLRFRVADARILRGTRECVAFLDRNLVFRIALVCVRMQQVAPRSSTPGAVTAGGLAKWS
jgi:hypothetical protein